ncbi:MAG: endonuclease III [Armatimonadetes bacterium]|nr:endonuclease III [Armatimonadota bacterium]
MEEHAGPDCLPKEPFDIHAVFRRLRRVCAALPKAALFELRDRGRRTPFEQLVAAVISVRTRDETTLPVAEALFARARTPEEVLNLSPEELERLLAPAAFSEAKARQIRAASALILERWNGALPADADALRSLPGVGPKVAGLVLALGFGVPAIAVDVHVHRITNRWGYVSTRTPEQTRAELYERLPRAYWVEINERLVPFGKFVCTGRRPKCSTCALLSQCRQVGVTDHG